MPDAGICVLYPASGNDQTVKRNMKRFRINFGIAVLSLGFLLVIRSAGGTGRPGIDSTGNAVPASFSQQAHVSLRVPLQSGENFSLGAVTASSEGDESASELNRKLTNPVSDIWSISNQFSS